MKRLYSFLLFLGCYSALFAQQSLYSKGTINMIVGGSLVLEDGNQFQPFFRGETVRFNVSPFLLGLDYRASQYLSIQANLNSVVYPERQRYYGLTSVRPLDVTYLFSSVKLNLLPVLKDTGNFEPYIFLGPGAILRGTNLSGGLNLGVGANYWFSNRIGMNITMTYFDFLPFVENKRSNYLVSFSSGIVFVLN